MEMKRATLLTVAKMLNATKDGEGNNVATVKVPVVAIGTEELKQKFLEACESVTPENEGLLPDQVCDVYNMLAGAEKEEETEEIMEEVVDNTEVAEEEQSEIADPPKKAKKTVESKKKKEGKEKPKVERTHIKKAGAGVIATAIVFLKQTKKGLTKEELISKLSEKFPEKKESSLLATIGWQIGSRKGEFANLEKLEGSKYRIA